MLDLTGILSIENTEIIIRYKGKNYFSETIFVAHLPSIASFKAYPNTAYCSLSPNGDHLNLLLGASPSPLKQEVEYGVMTFFAKVPQNDFIEGEIRLKLPFQEWNGYFLPNADAKMESVTVQKINLHIEVIPESAVRWARPARIAPDYFEVSGEVLPFNLTFLSKVLLSVDKRKDEEDFPRPDLSKLNFKSLA